MALENDAAQVEADKCAVIAKDVSELAARCEADLAAAEPLVAQAEAALDTLNKKDLGEPHSFLLDVLPKVLANRMENQCRISWCLPGPGTPHILVPQHPTNCLMLCPGGPTGAFGYFVQAT